ncbi:S-adenosyl-L-methionine-dependent methyltransferase [Nemania sp. FL0916]|nr:S-adenosyl-L-methionine-dependent methyltransferase [Nemania sp. FL0916]
MSAPRIVELAQRIANNTSKVSEYLTANELPQPSFDIDAPLYGPVPRDAEPEIVNMRQSVLEDIEELQHLMLGSRDLLATYCFNHNSLLPHQVITRFGLARNLPIGGETTFAEMAASSGLAENDIRKLIRYAVTQRVFEEPRPGVITHSAASRLLAEDTAAHDYLATAANEFWPAATRTCDAMIQFPGSEEPTQTGFALANNTDKSFYQFLSDYPDRSKRFANMMLGFTSGKEYSLHYVTDFYPWDELSGGTVVDVGGSQGFVCVALARKFPSLSFVVQDLEPVITEAQKNVPAEVADRISFMAHDFFNPQPVSGADVYYLRWVLHNWPDKYCIKILRNLIPALKPGAKVILHEAILPSPGEVPKNLESQLRSFDLVMTTSLNAKERDLSDWTGLFQSADEKFEYQGVTTPPGSGISMIVAVWKGD